MIPKGNFLRGRIDMIGLPLHSEAGRPSQKAGLLLLLVLLFIGCSWRQPLMLPVQMFGEWRTQEPRYQGRFIRLDNIQITFGLGGLAPNNSERIEKVKMVSPKTPTDYVLELKAADGTPDSITLLFSPENGGELRIKNQPTVVWTHQLRGGPSKMLPSGAKEAAPLDGARVEHKTIYKIDCLLPEHCHSY
jgi:hypothetical protein